MGKELMKPSEANSEAISDLLEGLVCKHKKGIRSMMNADASALSAVDMKYFPQEYWGRVPRYGRFMRSVRESCPELAVQLEEMEARELGGYYEQGMRDIYERPTEEMDGLESKRFAWGEKLYKIQERKLDRLDKLLRDGQNEKTADLAARLISALSNSELLKAKEVIEAEWREVDGAK